MNYCYLIHYLCCCRASIQSPTKSEEDVKQVDEDSDYESDEVYSLLYVWFFYYLK